MLAGEVSQRRRLRLVVESGLKARIHRDRKRVTGGAQPVDRLRRKPRRYVDRPVHHCPGVDNVAHQSSGQRLGAGEPAPHEHHLTRQVGPDEARQQQKDWLARWKEIMIATR